MNDACFPDDSGVCALCGEPVGPNDPTVSAAELRSKAAAEATKVANRLVLDSLGENGGPIQAAMAAELVPVIMREIIRSVNGNERTVQIYRFAQSVVGKVTAIAVKQPGHSPSGNAVELMDVSRMNKGGRA